MTKKRFALVMADGAEVRNIDDLKAHFDIDSVVREFKDGRLFTWLEDRYYDEEVDALKKLSPEDESLARKLCEVFEQFYLAEEMARREERLNRLKQHTNDKNILANVDKVAFDQEDLADLLDADAKEIYLCANRFVIPLRMKNKNYIGMGSAVAVIHGKEPVDFNALNITFQNISFDEDYQKILNQKNLPTVSNQSAVETPTEKAEFVDTIKGIDSLTINLAAAFVNKAAAFQSKIQLKAKGKTVDAKNIIAVLNLELGKRNKITVTAEGVDAKKAIAALQEFVDSGFKGDVKGNVKYFEASIDKFDVNAATVFVNKAAAFESEIWIRIENRRNIDGKKILNVIDLESAEFDKIIVIADGSDSEKAVAALKKLIDSGFKGNSATLKGNVQCFDASIDKFDVNAATLFVNKAVEFKSKIWIKPRGKGTFDGKNIFNVLDMNSPEHKIIVIVKGSDAVKAVAALKKLIDSGFKGDTTKLKIKYFQATTTNKNRPEGKIYYVKYLSSEFSKKASTFKSKICLKFDGGYFSDIKNISGIRSLFSEVTIGAEGSDAQKAVTELKKLVDSGAWLVESSMIEATTTVTYRCGFHAGPSSMFVQKASSFKSKIQLKAKGKTVDAKSILMIMSMGLVKGTEITIVADGPDAKEAVKTLIELVDNEFGRGHW